jgi:hypothetical protein
MTNELTPSLVYKFRIHVADEFEILMPAGAQVLYVDAQQGEPMMWARVPLYDVPNETRTFWVRGTGHPVPAGARYLGSFQLHGGTFVGHLFEGVAP